MLLASTSRGLACRRRQMSGRQLDKWAWLGVNASQLKPSLCAGHPSPSRQQRDRLPCHAEPFGRRIFDHDLQQAEDPQPSSTSSFEMGPELPPSMLMSMSTDNDERMGALSSGEASSGGLAPSSPPGTPARLDASEARPPSKRDVRIVSRIKQRSNANQQQQGQAFWNSFMNKCRDAWDIFFPTTGPKVLTPARAVNKRLRWVLVADRSGMGLPELLQMKENSVLAVLGEDQLDLELQVSSVTANGDRVNILSVPLLDIAEQAALRDPSLYHYEDDELETEMVPIRTGAESVLDMEEEGPMGGSFILRRKGKASPAGGQARV